MGRIRTIKPELWENEDLAVVSEPANLMAIGLLNYCDDEGYFNANPLLIKAAIFPLREPSQTIRRMIDELSSAGYIDLFEGVDGKNYGHVRNFTKHQRVDRPKPSKIKDLRPIDDESTNDRRNVPVGTGNREQGSNNDGAADAYPFEGETIRLNQKHYDELFRKYPNLDIRYQLDQLDSELRGKKNWYVEMHSKLNYRNRTPAHQKQQAESRGIEV